MTKSTTWMPLYIGDYLADTMALNAEEHGAYLLLIMHYWRNGALADDDRALAAIARVERRAWATIGPVVRAFFTVTDGLLLHKRIDKERSAAQQNVAKKKAAAEARWRKPDMREPCARPADASADAHAGASIMQGECMSPSPSPSSSSSLRSEHGARAPTPDLPGWMPADAWNGFLDMRKKARKPATARAMTLLIGKLAALRQQGFEPGAVLDQSTQSGWSDVYPLKEARAFAGGGGDQRRQASDAAWANVPIIPGT